GLEGRGQLGAGGGLAGAIDAEHEDHARPRIQRQPPGRTEGIEQEATEDPSQLTGTGDGAVHHFLATAVDEVGGHGRAQVRRDEHFLELFPERLVDRTLRLHYRLWPGTEELLGTTQTITQLLADAGKELHPG